MRAYAENDQVYNGIMQFTASFWAAYSYFIPVVIFIGLYSSVINTLRKHDQSTLVSQRLSTASKNLTRTSIIVTSCFIILTGFDFVYYLLIRLHLVTFPDGFNIWYHISIFLTSLNFGINPAIYVCTMPIFRKLVCGLMSNKRSSNSRTRGSTSSETRF